MSNTLKVKRGTNLSNAGTPEAGELIYKSDSNELFVGDGSTAATGLTAIGGSGSGDISSVVAGTGLSGGATSGDATLVVDLSELTDMTASVNSSQDELIILDNGADRRKLISEIPLSAFNNDSGFITATLTTEAVQDIVGAMFSSNTETRISASYQDGDGTIDLVVDDMTANDNTQLSDEQVQDIVGAMFTGNTETRITATYQDSDGTIDLVVDDLDTDTQLTTENVQDIVGAMFSSNTETRISATYQDGDGTIDLVVDDMTADNNTNQLTTFTLTADSGSNQTIAHGNTLDIAGGTNITTSVGSTDTVTINVDDAFLKNNADDTTSGTITAGGFTTTGTVTAGGSSTQVRLRTVSNASPIADTFSGNTEQSYIDFLESTSSNDPGFIMHETNDDSETNEGVIHLCPSDDNAEGDYISIHGTNDADQIKLHTSGKVEGVTTLVAADLDISGDVDVDGTLETDALTINGTTSVAFTSSDHSKLDGIESGATADQSASEILTAIKTVDGGGSGLDADTLDGIQSSAFLRSDTGDTAAGNITFTGKVTASNGFRATNHFTADNGTTTFDGAVDMQGHVTIGSSTTDTLTVVSTTTITSDIT